VPIVRTFVPIVAGIAHMEYKLFIRYSLISSLLWSASVTLSGYFLGHLFPHLKDYLSYLIILIVIVSALPMIFELRKKS
jgi:membrane-associated protein